MEVTKPRGALLQLRDQLKAATGPDRELDEAIALAFGWTANDLTPLRWFLPPNNGEWVMSPPRFTASLDATMALVPDGDDWFWRIGHGGEGPDPSAFKAEILGPDVGPKISATADTPALALCLARIEYELARPTT